MPDNQALAAFKQGFRGDHQGFAAGGMGFRVKLHSSNFEPLMSALGQKQT